LLFNGEHFLSPRLKFTFACLVKETSLSHTQGMVPGFHGGGRGWERVGETFWVELVQKFSALWMIFKLTCVLKAMLFSIHSERVISNL
jgi:hypothetical protein